jgi:hypothetical protein
MRYGASGRAAAPDRSIPFQSRNAFPAFPARGRSDSPPGCHPGGAANAVGTALAPADVSCADAGDRVLRRGHRRRRARQMKGKSGGVMKHGDTRLQSRRNFLMRGGAVALCGRFPALSRALLVVPAAFGALARDAAAAGGFSDWSQHARIADASFGASPDDSELQGIVSNLVAQNVSVAETDTVLSNWATDAQFSASMSDAARFNQMVHAPD